MTLLASNALFYEKTVTSRHHFQYSLPMPCADVSKQSAPSSPPNCPNVNSTTCNFALMQHACVHRSMTMCEQFFYTLTVFVIFIWCALHASKPCAGISVLSVKSKICLLLHSEDKVINLRHLLQVLSSKTPYQALTWIESWVYSLGRRRAGFHHSTQCIWGELSNLWCFPLHCSTLHCFALQFQLHWGC